MSKYKIGSRYVGRFANRPAGRLEKRIECPDKDSESSTCRTCKGLVLFCRAIIPVCGYSMHIGEMLFKEVEGTCNDNSKTG